MLHSVAVSCEVEDFAFKNEPVENSCGDNRVAQEVSPVIEAFVRGQYERFVFVTVGDEREQEVGFSFRDGHKANFVQDNERCAIYGG